MMMDGSPIRNRDSVPERALEVRSTIAELESHAQGLEKLAAQLGDRLKPILSGTPKDEPSRPPRDARQSPVGQTIDEVNNTLSHIYLRLNNLLERLEL